MNSLIDDTTKGTVQNTASALGAVLAMLSNMPDGNGLYFLLLPILDALEHEAGL